MFNKVDAVVCPACLPSEEDDYERVRQALQEYPEMSAEGLAEAADIDLGCILRFLEDGRIETTAANSTVVCGRCGSRAISLSKRLCESCLQKLNAELTSQQGQIQLTKKKRVEVGTAFNMSNKSGPIKYQR
jgi:ribosomal protein L37E